ncbi:TetR/AcrR family transcriptional regulator [Pseudorhodoplanes sp.]|jgi:TetR/AcrR family transcriptional repressor of nem operon|uniref:TetR/AcrR family transcriptional regulator n=2 Tax=Nitrobacteraceae TaxID=41294 RepID=A0A7C9RJN3_9BRAD|nr:TetR/AcrR family transcriptional regulator [uncultured Mesorhizobium sp.]MBR1139226.1 TetR/AcrR family transcriptional regulator [Bradyrhizobium denitrificans]NGX98999.1 TetR/AcrR family transcriptional regulator [Candidatus Afipia apatlaquensis]
MARPREFEEGVVLDAAMECFWNRGYEATSMRDLVDKTGITGASLYNAFGDKRAIYQRALDRYVEGSVAARLARCEELPPLEAIVAFFDDIVSRSVEDRSRKGCMLVNAALDVAPHDDEFQRIVAEVMTRIELFFRDCVQKGQEQGAITSTMSAEELGRHLLGVLLGVRVLARVRPDRILLEGVVRPAIELLDIGSSPRHRDH